MNPDDVNKLTDMLSKSYVRSFENDLWTSQTVSTWQGKTIDYDDLRSLFDEFSGPKVKYKEIEVSGNWHTVKIHDRAVRNWVKEHDLHLWSPNNDGSYDIHNSLWIMLCLAWEA